jgi:hypothetical protein
VYPSFKSAIDTALPIPLPAPVTTAILERVLTAPSSKSGGLAIAAGT